ncbi:unnamed protein product [Sphenostylis stenocarpa]|uniref:Activator of Hsp90 ATPase AHSA1-like N-terminal domain-containing protein n=1 Tax=Sphenostylis stenocarpa TaxID=92480 RepID=A0AA86SCB0_9FABA|nr:unnamed protein product [Sphenostylis stenocarpa]
MCKSLGKWILFCVAEKIGEGRDGLDRHEYEVCFGWKGGSVEGATVERHSKRLSRVMVRNKKRVGYTYELTLKVKGEWIVQGEKKFVGGHIDLPEFSFGELDELQMIDSYSFELRASFAYRKLEMLMDDKEGPSRKYMIVEPKVKSLLMEIRLSEAGDILHQDRIHICNDLKLFLQPIREKLLQFEQELRECGAFSWETEKCGHIFMFFMSSSTVLCDNLILFNQKLLLNSFVSHGSSNFVIHLGSKARRLNGFISKAEKHSGHARKSSWWQKFFFEDDGNWLGMRDDDMVEPEPEAVAAAEGESTQELSEGEKFEAWKQRAEAIVELREAQEDRRNAEYRRWEDWLLDGDGANQDGNASTSDWEQGMKDYRENVRADSGDVPADKGLVESARYLIFGREDDDMLYEDRVFQYASSNSVSAFACVHEMLVIYVIIFLFNQNPHLVNSLALSKKGGGKHVFDPSSCNWSWNGMIYNKNFRYSASHAQGLKRYMCAKFLAVLIIVPWAMDFLVHDYILMPFLDRYVKTVPLAAQMLDVRRYQKLEIVEELKTERGRFELEVEIGKSPPLSDDEVWWELRHKALELREERRLENRRAFANIWSDTVYGISLFILLYFNKSKVALLKFTGYKIINNISDTGKAFLIILITDIFLGYHSESGWQTLLEIIVEHYGLEVDQSAITIFVCLIPVVMDACVKLWLFKFLPRLSPRVTNIFREMKRH